MSTVHHADRGETTRVPDSIRCGIKGSKEGEQVPQSATEANQVKSTVEFVQAECLSDELGGMQIAVSQVQKVEVSSDTVSAQSGCVKCLRSRSLYHWSARLNRSTRHVSQSRPLHQTHRHSPAVEANPLFQRVNSRTAI